MKTEIKLVSSFARFVQADIKGGEHAQAYRREIIATAVEQAYKGNYSPMTEALALTEGKAKKARAYAAGFAALGGIGETDANGRGIVKVPYVGKLDSHDNKDARALIASKSEASVTAFFAAFDVVMAEKAAPKAKATAPVAAPDVAPAAPNEQHEEAVTLDNSVLAMEAMIRTGALTSDQLDRLSAALVAVLDADLMVELAAACGAELDRRAALAA